MEKDQGKVLQEEGRAVSQGNTQGGCEMRRKRGAGAVLEVQSWGLLRSGVPGKLPWGRGRQLEEEN